MIKKEVFGNYEIFLKKDNNKFIVSFNFRSIELDEYNFDTLEKAQDEFDLLSRVAKHAAKVIENNSNYINGSI